MSVESLLVPTDSAAAGDRLIPLGRIVGLFGVKGELKLESDTEPRDAIFRYQPWELRMPNGRNSWVQGVHGRDTGRNVIARFPEVDDRDQAQLLVGAQIWVPRKHLPASKPGSYYWVDLEGMAVQTLDGVALGRVSHMLATGANDVMVVEGERERWVPFILDNYVKSVDLEARLIRVDWDPEF